MAFEVFALCYIGTVLLTLGLLYTSGALDLIFNHPTSRSRAMMLSGIVAAPLFLAGMTGYGIWKIWKGYPKVNNPLS